MLSIGNTSHETTPDIDGGSNPEWNQAFSLPVSPVNSRIQVMVMLDQSKVDSIVGTGSQDASEALSHPGKSFTCKNHLINRLC